jgi:hypothetical protein
MLQGGVLEQAQSGTVTHIEPPVPGDGETLRLTKPANTPPAGIKRDTDAVSSKSVTARLRGISLPFILNHPF